MQTDINSFSSEHFQSLVSQCIHCGLCLQACPTYRLWGTETDSPRGRIALIKALSEGRFEPQEIQTGFSQHIDACLACRSCESACPSGVQYGQIVEHARVFIETQRQPKPAERFVRWSGTRFLMPHPARLRLLAQMLRVYQVLGIQKLVRRWKRLPFDLQVVESLLPPLESLNSCQPAALDPSIPGRGRVLFFSGCIQEGFLPGVNAATCRVLQHNGFEVIRPELQTCCGAAHTHLGDLKLACELARKNIDAFQEEGCLAIISNAGGCGLALKEYSRLLADDPLYAEKAKIFSAQVQDISEFLAIQGITPPPFPVKVKAVYADSCHLRHGQKVVDQPRQLLQQIPGLELIELQSPEQCCGSAGVYNIAHSHTAQQILALKLSDISSSGASLVVTSNPGCQLQLSAGVRQSGLPARVVHVIEVLDWAYEHDPVP